MYPERISHISQLICSIEFGVMILIIIMRNTTIYFNGHRVGYLPPGIFSPTEEYRCRFVERSFELGSLCSHRHLYSFQPMVNHHHQWPNTPDQMRSLNPILYTQIIVWFHLWPSRSPIPSIKSHANIENSI